MSPNRAMLIGAVWVILLFGVVLPILIGLGQ